MKSFLKKIEFSYFYLFMALSFVLGGYFINILIITSLIIIHELGHYIVIKYYNIKINKIVIYPYGGLTKYNNIINERINKELLISIMGLLFQTIYFLFIFILYKNNFIREYTYNLFKTYHYAMFIFNILPIYPLDGYKILNLLLSKYVPFNLSNKISIYISLLSIIFMLLILKYNYIYILTISILIKYIFDYYKNLDYIYSKFLLERYLYKIKYNKLKIINSKNNMYKEYSHIIKNGNIYEKERQILVKMFDTRYKI